MGFLIFLTGLAIMTLAFSLYSYRICFYSPRKRQQPDNIESWFPKGEQYEAVRERMIASEKRMEDAACEWTTTRSHDGKKLYARYYEFSPDAPLMLVFHGYRGYVFRDCAGGFALAGKLGFNILAVDQRSHGKSDGCVITFGIRERQDCLSWIRYARQRFGAEKPLILSGVSMGAATVLMASELDLPENVVCIMADCPYSSPSAIIRKVASEMGYPDLIAYPIIRLGARLFGGFCLTESSATNAVKRATVPILMIHGEDDRFVPCDMSREIYENCKDVAQLHTFPNAGHGLSYLVDPRRYEKICVDFLWGIDSMHPYLDQSEFAAQLHSA